MCDKCKFILASNDTTNKRITAAVSLKFKKKIATIFNRKNAKSYNSLCCKLIFSLHVTDSY